MRGYRKIENIIKTQIAIGLFTGLIVSAFFVLMGTIAEKFIFEKIKKLSTKSHYTFGIIFVIGFIFIIILTSMILLRVLLAPTDLHILGDIFRKILGIK